MRARGKPFESFIDQLEELAERHDRNLPDYMDMALKAPNEGNFLRGQRYLLFVMNITIDKSSREILS